MGCTIGLIRWLMFIFNFICCLVGLALIALGASAHLKVYQAIKELNLDAGHVLSTGMIVVGSIIFIIAFFGCCGAVRESHCMVITFSLCLLTIVVIQVAAAIFVILNKDKLDTIDDKLENFFLKEIHDYNDPENGAKSFVDGMQEHLKCCGVNSSLDWNGTPFKQIPASCCPTNKQTGNSCSSSDAYSKGCKAAFIAFIKKWSKIIGIAAIVLAVIEVGGIIAGLCLANTIRNEERRAYRV